MELAVKKVAHESRQRMKAFVVEIVSIDHMRHRNLVLLGYCRRKGELLWVYDFMLDGNLDRFLHDHTQPTLKGVASALSCLHEH